jgi:ubiquinone biosynthesis accessory factor UbiK
MIKPENIDELVQQIQALLPEDMRQTKEDVEKNIKTMMRATLQRMDLVTREEFDIQQQLLVNTRCLLEELKDRIRQLEQGLDKDED